MATVVAAVVAIAVLLFLHRGDAEGSARIANREIEDMLQRGEVVERRVAVQRRRWFDYFRVTHGVLAATDRRLLYVGIPPAELLPREPEPQELDVLIAPYERPLAIARTRAVLNTMNGVTISVAGGTVTYAVAALDRSRLDAVLAVVSRRQAEREAAAVAERRAEEAASEASRRAVTHLVRPGEALTTIAARYGTSVDSLRQWNGLASDRIAAGQRLIVRPER